MTNMRRFISHFAEERGLSLSEIAERLSYKSKTSLVRLMDENVREKSVYRFQRTMRAAFELTPSEEEALNEAVEIKLYGSQKQEIFREMRGLLRALNSAKPEAEPFVEDVKNGARERLFERYTRMKNVHIHIFNAADAPIYRALASFLHQENASANHYICTHTDDVGLIRAMRMALPAFYAQGYEIGIYAGDVRQSIFGMMGADAMAVFYEDEDGKAMSDMIAFEKNGAAKRLTLQKEAGLRELLCIRPEMFLPIKKTHTDNSSPEEYIEYSKYISSMERDRSILKLKPDMGLEHIRPEILRDALLENPVSSNDALPKALEELTRIYTGRYQNTFTKKKHAHMIVKLESMRQFARTGRMSDHFWGMRPFTEKERALILEDLRQNAIKNPYFHLYFLEDEMLFDGVEIDCYGNESLLIAPSQTDYSFSNGYSEIMLTNRRIMALFKEFFIEELVKRYSRPESASAALLEEIIVECKRCAPAKADNHVTEDGSHEQI